MALITILVEDNLTIRETLVPAMVELANARVVVYAATAIEAKDALRMWDSRWDLIVVDLFLAQGSGLEVLQSVPPRAAHQHVIVLSNYATAAIRSKCLALGADRVFDKSTELDAFFEFCSTLKSPETD